MLELDYMIKNGRVLYYFSYLAERSKMICYTPERAQIFSGGQTRRRKWKAKELMLGVGRPAHTHTPLVVRQVRVSAAYFFSLSVFFSFMCGGLKCGLVGNKTRHPPQSGAEINAFYLPHSNANK